MKTGCAWHWRQISLGRSEKKRSHRKKRSSKENSQEKCALRSSPFSNSFFPTSTFNFNEFVCGTFSLEIHGHSVGVRHIPFSLRRRLAGPANMHSQSLEGRGAKLATIATKASPLFLAICGETRSLIAGVQCDRAARANCTFRRIKLKSSGAKEFWYPVNNV